MTTTRRTIFCALVAGLFAACGGDVDSTSSDADAGALDASVDASVEADADATDAGPTPITRENVLDWVDPFIGTKSNGFANGAMTPAAQAPLGMVRVGPDTTSGGRHGTTLGRFSGFDIDDPEVRGFSHLHFVGTGVADYGNVRFLPATRERVERPKKQWFADFVEQDAGPGWYRAQLAEPAVEAEITAGIRAAIHRYEFESQSENLIVLDPSSSVTDSGVLGAEWSVDGTVWTAELTYQGPYVGRSRPMPIWVSVELSSEPRRVERWDEATETWLEVEFPNVSGESTAALLTFDEAEVELRVGLSFLGPEQAESNRAEETSEGAEVLRDRTEEAWRDYLSRIIVEGGTDEERTIFYTALYNSFRMPTRFDEAGRYRGLDGRAHDLGDGQDRYFSDLSLWDTYRTLHPLWIVIAPDAQRDALASLLRMSEDGGYVPRWPAGLSYTGGMEGEPGAILFGESAAKGLDGVDYEAAYAALSAVADASPPPGANYGARQGIERYVELGWIPADEFGKSASNTLEWALADHALGALADRVGDLEAAERYRARGESWRAIYREDEGFFWPRNADGSWGEIEGVEVHYGRSGVYVEGSAWHYRFHVQHDPEGLARLMGEEVLAERLEFFFENSKLFGDNPAFLLFPDVFYWHTNQPSIHSVVNFGAAGRVDRLSYWTRRVQDAAYGTGPDGLVGNDDGGTLSAWYVWSAIGLYPIVGTDRYSVMPPVFPRATVRLEDGSELVVEAPGASRDVGRIDNVTVDGEPVGPLEIRHEDLQDGAVVRYDLTTFE